MAEQATRDRCLIATLHHSARVAPPIGRLLGKLPASAQVRTTQSVDELAALVESDVPDLLVVWQEWPDEFPACEVARLFDLLPVSRWVCCYGPWCLADGRNRDIWPPATRVPWSRAESRIRQELSVLRGEHAPLPLTAGRDEVFAYDVDRSDGELSSPLRFPRTAVISCDPEYRRCLLESLGDSRRKSRLQHSEGLPDAILWDADPWNAVRANSLWELRRAHASTAILALTSLSDHYASEILRNGADEVLPKLGSLDQLRRRVSGVVAVRKGAT